MSSASASVANMCLASFISAGRNSVKISACISTVRALLLRQLGWCVCDINVKGLDSGRSHSSLEPEEQRVVGGRKSDGPGRAVIADASGIGDPACGSARHTGLL